MSVTVFYPMLFSVFFIWSLFFLFCMCIYVCMCVDMYAVCMLYICACPYGGQKSTLDLILQMPSIFLVTGSLADLVLTGSPASASTSSVCTTRPGLHGHIASISLTEHLLRPWFFFLSPAPSCTLVKFFSLIFVYFCPYVCLPRFPPNHTGFYFSFFPQHD